MPLIIEKQARNVIYKKNEGAKLYNKEMKPSGYNSKNIPFFFFFATS